MSRLMFLLGAVLVVAIGFAVRPYLQDSSAVERAHPAGGAAPDHLYGRVTTVDGDLFEGPLRFGGDEEALWSNHFNGVRRSNIWVRYVPSELLPGERHSWRILGVEISVAPRKALKRPFLARFGDITRIEARGRDLQVTLKSGSVVRLDRYAADDFADGVRIWDRSGQIVDLPERRVRTIEFFAPPVTHPNSLPLYGTVQTRQGTFTGLIQWDREAALYEDRLRGRSVTGEPVDLRFDAIRSIVRQGDGGAYVELQGGGEVLLARARAGRNPHRGVYVDDVRYGRVLISWDALERLDLERGGNAPSYSDFQPGSPLEGMVTTRSGEELSGRIVFDLDESESTETLDAPAGGVDYMIPFSMITAVEPLGPAASQGALIGLQSGEMLHLEPAGDLGAENGGLLVFGPGAAAPSYLHWSAVGRIEFWPRVTLW